MLVCLSVMLFPINTEDEESFVTEVMRLEFENAKKIAIQLDSSNKTRYYSHIVSFFGNAGQYPISDKKKYYDLKSKENLDLVLGPFCKGLFLLYNKEENNKANSKKTENKAYFQLFKALSEAKENDHAILPLIYLAILELYGQEIVQSSKDYYEYLEEFNKISTNLSEKSWYQIHRIRYFSKSNEEGHTGRFFAECESLSKFYRKYELSIPSRLRAYFYYYLGMFNRNKGNVVEAEFYFKKILQDFSQIPFYNYICFISNLFLCQLSSQKTDFTVAKSYLEKAKEFWNKSDSTRSRFIQKRYSAFYYYEKLGLFEDGFRLLKSSIDDEVILDYRNNTFLITEGRVKYDTAQKEKQILVEQQRAMKNRNWLIAATVALLLGTGIAVLLQKNTSKKRQLAEQEAILKQERVDNLLKEQELVSIDAMIAGQEKERQKVAGELHDDLGSLMATIKLHFENAKVSKKDPALQNAQKLLEEAYQKIRGMAHSKNSGVMSDQGLLSAIKKMAKTITETNALEVGVEDFGMGERMENSMELSIFRMVQELVANTIKHAEASKVNIQLTQHEDNLNIIVEDNGKGFDRSKLDKDRRGMGLTNIEKRVEHLEGNFTIDSVLGKGTSILIDIPV